MLHLPIAGSYRELLWRSFCEEQLVLGLIVLSPEGREVVALGLF